MTTLAWLVVAVLAAAGTAVLGVHALGRALDRCRDWRLDQHADREQS